LIKKEFSIKQRFINFQIIYFLYSAPSSEGQTSVVRLHIAKAKEVSKVGSRSLVGSGLTGNRQTQELEK